MNHTEHPDSSAADAAIWVLRHDRGLTAAEQDDFSHWLAADPRHRAAWAEQRWGWDELDRLAGLQASLHAVPDPNLLAPQRRVVPPMWAWSFAAAAVVLGVFVFSWREAPTDIGMPETKVASVAPSIPLIEQRELPDGSVVELNRGAVIEEHYMAGERRVVLRTGEAHFRVTKDPTRPFFVEASGVSVRAVGTAFNVRMDASSVEVLVTEGQVEVAAREGAPNPKVPVLAANERTVIYLIPFAPVPQVTMMPKSEVEARLAWQPKMLDFDDASMMEIVAEFNRRNDVRLVVIDPELGAMRLSATLRSDNVTGLVRLLQSEFGVEPTWKHQSEVDLKLAR